MKRNSCLLNGVILTILFLLGCGVGFFVTARRFTGDEWRWTHYQVQPMPKTGIDIVHVDIQSSVEDDPTNDVVYVETEGGEIYSNTLFLTDWQLVDPVPDWDNGYYITKCATEWSKHPPVENGVVDSAGVSFDHALAVVRRCYILFDDGSLQAWVYTSAFGDSSAAMAGYAFLGGAIGIVIGLFVICLRKTR